MKFQYCPNCAGISTMVSQGGLKKCSRCNYVGDPKEGSAADADNQRKRINAGYVPATGMAGMPSQQPTVQRTNPDVHKTNHVYDGPLIAELKQNGNSYRRPHPSRNSSMNTTIKQSALKEQSDMKKIGLEVDERLKGLKGKKSENSEFL